MSHTVPGTAPMTSTTAPRARLATRFVALLIDLVIVSGLVAAIGLTAAAVTDGRVRISSSVVSAQDCQTVPVPEPLALPNSVTADVRRCTRSLFGFVYDRQLIVLSNWGEGQASGDPSPAAIPLDKAGQPVHPVYLDILVLPALALYLLLLEWRRGTTPGKWLVGAEVVSEGGGRPSLLQSAERTLARVIVLVPAMIVEISGLPEPGSRISLKLITSSGPESIIVGLLGWVTVAYLIATIVLAMRGSRPPHDLWAGTDVVCPGSPS